MYLFLNIIFLITAIFIGSLLQLEQLERTFPFLQARPGPLPRLPKHHSWCPCSTRIDRFLPDRSLCLARPCPLPRHGQQDGGGWMGDSPVFMVPGRPAVRHRVLPQQQLSGGPAVLVDWGLEGEAHELCNPICPTKQSSSSMQPSRGPSSPSSCN